MRSFLAPLALAAAFALPAAAQAPRFIKVDITAKSDFGGHHGHQGKRNSDGPTEVHMRMPISLARGILDMAQDGEVRVNGKDRKGMKADELIKLLENAKPGDLLLEITTDKGDLVRVVVE